MISVREAASGLMAAYRLARLDAGGMALIEATAQGCRRSFWAALYAAPFYVVLAALRLEDPGDDPLRAILIETIGYALAWTAFPLAAWYIIRARGYLDRYFGYIAAYNWANVLQVAIYVPIQLIEAGGVLPDAVVTLLALGMSAAVLYYQYFIARTALSCAAGPAANLVFVDFMIGLILTGLLQSLHQRS